MPDEANSLTVAQLIEILRKEDQDLKVFTEGCDCLGSCTGVRVDLDSQGHARFLLIERSGD